MRLGEPNFRVEIEGSRGTTTELHDAASREALEASLQERVRDRRIRGFKVRPYDFSVWKRKARKETANVIRARRRGEPYDFDAHRTIWGEMKDYLRVLFNGKCAYCDARFDVVAWGDVEHYRPKRKVTSLDGKSIEHPGYYWLAYDLSNLLPSCQLCNQAKGKANRFPLREEGARARTPRPFYPRAEVPLLFNAYLHEPKSHLRFITTEGDIAFGTVTGLDDIGQTTSEVYDLNREELIEVRRERQNAARARLKEALVREDSGVIAQMVRDCMEGRTEFSEAVLAEIESYFDTMRITLRNDPVRPASAPSHASSPDGT